MRLALGLIALAILAGACSKRPTSSAAFNIRPGYDFGPLHAGMTMEQVQAVLGPPDRKSNSNWTYANFGFWVNFGNTNHTVHIVMCSGGHTSDPAVKGFVGHTQEGIGIGSTRAEVITAYGEPSATQKTPNRPDFEVLHYRPQGLDFSLDAGKVTGIAVIFRSAALSAQ